MSARGSNRYRDAERRRAKRLNVKKVGKGGKGQKADMPSPGAPVRRRR